MRKFEWITIGVMVACYGVFFIGTTSLVVWSPVLAVLITAAAVALHSSLQHEVIHGHPTPWKTLNEALVFPALTLIIPFARFRDTHIAHHQDSRLTDPYDDPESNFMDRDGWSRRTLVCRILLNFNNTLAGRLLIGVAVAQVWFMVSDLRAIRRGDRQVLIGWLRHLPAAGLVLVWVIWAEMAVWQYIIAAYIGNAIIKIRTYAEHRAHELSRARSVIIDDRGLLAFLFLNNNLHAVHHAKPGLAWYDLPAHYRNNQQRYLDQNDGYQFGSYRELFAGYFLRRKDPVPHPMLQRDRVDHF